MVRAYCGIILLTKAFHLLLVLVPQRPFPVVGATFSPTPPVDHVLHHTLSVYGRFIQCIATCCLLGQCGTAPQHPLLVQWGPAPYLVPHSPAFLPRCGCRACVGTARVSLTPLRPQRAQAYCSVFSIRPRRGHSSVSSTSPLGLCSVPQSLLTSVASSLWVPGPRQHRRRTAHSAAPPAHMGALSGALLRVLRQAGGRPPFHILHTSPGALHRASFLIPKRYFLDVDAGPVSASPMARSLHRALSAHRRTVACSLLGQGEATPRCPLQVPRGYAPYLSPCSPALLPRRGCQARANTAGGPRTPPRPQRTRALYPMHCSVFSARLGGDHPSTTSTIPLVVRSVP
ncbi:hypothetical protein NDU88_004207 [Pleurodeles waltl]|uniref:Uncharacterized protein n=1 Tax=Pleurodeles waltl TaxID=8319 RepID=A0AAV7MUT8_PLEWA|nr:hypothetical protein NDU88_004207 [Pleurodeles waltl]